MKYKVKKSCAKKVFTFYMNVSRKYKHTYSNDLMHKNIDDAINSMFHIEQTLLRRKPTLARWQKPGWHMAHAGQWYYAYTISGDTVTIEDASHAQNMHE